MNGNKKPAFKSSSQINDWHFRAPDGTGWITESISSDFTLNVTKREGVSLPQFSFIQLDVQIMRNRKSILA